MTVQDLIDALSVIEDKSRLVLVSIDAEGNGYKELTGAEESDDMEKYGYCWEYSGEESDTPVVVLWP